MGHPGARQAPGAWNRGKLENPRTGAERREDTSYTARRGREEELTVSHAPIAVVSRRRILTPQAGEASARTWQKGFGFTLSRCNRWDCRFVVLGWRILLWVNLIAMPCTDARNLDGLHRYGYSTGKMIPSLSNHVQSML